MSTNLWILACVVILEWPKPTGVVQAKQDPNSAETPFWQSKSLLIMSIPFRVEVSTKKHHCPQPAYPPTCEFFRVWSFWNDPSQQKLFKPNKTLTMQKHHFGSQSHFRSCPTHLALKCQTKSTTGHNLHVHQLFNSCLCGHFGMTQA